MRKNNHFHVCFYSYSATDCFSYSLRLVSCFSEYFFSTIFRSVTAAAAAITSFFFARAIINNKLTEMGMFHLLLLMKSFYAANVMHSEIGVQNNYIGYHHHMEHMNSKKYLSFICSRNTFIVCKMKDKTEKKEKQRKNEDGWKQEKKKKHRKTKLKRTTSL